MRLSCLERYYERLPCLEKCCVKLYCDFVFFSTHMDELHFENQANDEASHLLVF